MSGSNFGDSMGWSSSGRRGKRGGGSAGGTDKPKQPQRGLGVAQLEKIRLQSEMAEYFHPLGQPPSLIHRTGSLNLEDARASTSSLSSLPSSSFHPTTISSPFPIHQNFAMPYGERDVRYSEFQAPIIRSPRSSAVYGNPHYAQHPNITLPLRVPSTRSPRSSAVYGNPHYAQHPNITLPLFEPQESARLKGHHDRSQSADSTSFNSDDPQDVDLELKL
ncbi:protein SPEAR3-like isoform X2 [Miscanthus floridulus]|uniref:protein SPEAR3-like isoform X2 n=1 Tax=Miscanthus floridulus TaxID=154761 RepID=UPI00345920FB